MTSLDIHSELVPFGLKELVTMAVLLLSLFFGECLMEPS
jgi:hypothetical protein